MHALTPVQPEVGLADKIPAGTVRTMYVHCTYSWYNVRTMYVHCTYSARWECFKYLAEKCSKMSETLEC